MISTDSLTSTTVLTEPSEESKEHSDDRQDRSELGQDSPEQLHLGHHVGRVPDQQKRAHVWCTKIQKNAADIHNIDLSSLQT